MSSNLFVHGKKKLSFYFYSRSAFKHKHSVNTNMVRTFPMSANANETFSWFFGSDHTGRDDVKISKGQSMCSQTGLCHAQHCDIN